MTLNEYQDEASMTADFDQSTNEEYTILGLVSEAGEVAGVRKKLLRCDFPAEEYGERLKKELGDVLWYVAMVAREHGFTLDEVASDNIKKLADRRERGKIKGDGDDR